MGSRRRDVSARDQAEQLIDDAWDIIDQPKAADLARKALQLDPELIDGYVILGLTLPSTIEQMAILREGVRRGKLIWAEEVKAPSRHYFWLDIDTRPFMRAVHNLALLLWDHGDRREATDLANFLLKLNPNDNQGMRHLLLAWCPVLGDWDRVDRLLQRYKDDSDTTFLYAACLNAFRKGEPTQPLLTEALDANPYVPAFLVDAQLLPSEDNPYAAFGIAMGSEHEAHTVADASREGWLAVKGAMVWLKKAAKAAPTG
jgi:tetratricopeptide (TPR) repeat protein